jgi:hypothetical protein
MLVYPPGPFYLIPGMSVNMSISIRRIVPMMIDDGGGGGGVENGSK